MILEYYLIPAVAKLRHASRDGRVVILDGFAGRGHYEDGSPGSPVNMGRLADKVRGWRNPVDLRVFNIETIPANYSELETSTQEWVSQGVITNYNTQFSMALDAVLSEAATSPLFAFLDPFRPTQLPFDDMKPLLTRNAITELLIVFHTPAIYRIINQVISQKTEEKTKAGSRARLDAIFGSDRWEKLLSETPTPDGVVQCFIDELAVHFGSPGRTPFIYTTPIEARHGHGLKYHVIFITRHTDGVRLINGAFVNEKRDAHSQSLGEGSTLSMFEEYADPMDASQIPMRVRNAVLEAAMADPETVWSFADLLLTAMKQRFGQFSETDYTRAVRGLLSETAKPRLVGLSGQKLKSGKWKVEDRLIMRLEQ